MTAFAKLCAEIRACEICAAELPLGPRPVFRGKPSARLMIIGQAPGTKVHESGIPWNDASGKQLRQWLDMDDDVFYDEAKIAIVPMGFCYPGVLPKGGDRPPRKECAPQWHPPLRNSMKNIELTLLVGQYAQAHYLGNKKQKTMTETVRRFRDYLPDFLPTPHPSWRTTHWEKKNPWFTEEVIPELRARVGDLLSKGSAR